MKENTTKYFKITTTFLVVVILFIYSSCKPKTEIEKISAITDRAQLPRLHATDITTVISDSGITRYRISTPEWDVYDKAMEPYWEFPVGIHFEKFDENLKVNANIHSNYARFNQYQKLWELRGNVRMTNLSGELFETEKLFWSQSQQKFYSDTLVKITRASSIIHAVGFESNQQLTKYIFKSTRGIFPVKD
jgi:LPS export ABC transporter protein LptC